MKITREDVVRVAELAYLDLSEDELEKYRRQIDEILDYIGKLNELDTSGVEPMAQVLADDQTADATCAKIWWCLPRWRKMCCARLPIRNHLISACPK